MIEQRPSRMQQAKEIVKALGLLAQFMFDPRADPLVVNYMQKRRNRIVDQNISVGLGGKK